MKPFPISTANPPEHRAELPAEADVVVIGGGVIGVSAALFLARAGRRVVLCEKGRIAGEQSSRNWGWVRVQGRDPAEIPVAQEAQRLWTELAPGLDTDIGLTQGGVVYLAEAESELTDYGRWLDAAAPFDVSSHMLSARETAALFLGAEKPWVGALYTPTDMRAEPFLAVPALARRARHDGAVIVEDCAVRGLDIAAGRVAGVITEKGRIAAPEVLLAGGAWSQLFLRHLGLSIPQLSVHATAMRTKPLPEVFAGAAADHAFAFRRRADGGYTLAADDFHEFYIGPDAFRALPHYLGHIRSNLGINLRPVAPPLYPDAWGTPRRWSDDSVSPFERMRVLNPRPHGPTVAQVVRQFSEAFPALGRVEIAGAWGGMIDTMPDVVPVVDRAPLAGLSVATGMSGHGFGIGPAFGRIAADLVMGRDPGHDLGRFRYDRFKLTNRPKPGPAL